MSSCSIWIPVFLVCIHLALISAYMLLSPADAPSSPHLRTSNETLASYSPTSSPTFVVPVAIMYMSKRAVRGDFMRTSTPESVCEESAHAMYACTRVAPLLSTEHTSFRKRAREMKRMLVSYEHHGVIAHEVEDVWTIPEFDIGAEREFWSGSNPDGSVASERCMDWTSVSGFGVIGSHTISESEAACNEERHLLCICKTTL